MRAVGWAHVRRKFVEVIHRRNNTAAAHQMVALIRKLYQVEPGAAEKTLGDRLIEAPLSDGFACPSGL